MTLLQELEAAGVNEVTVVVGHLGEQIRDLLDGFSVRFAEQPEVLGSADALRRAVVAGARTPFIVSVADTVFAPGDLRRFAETWEQSGADGALAPPLWGVGPEVLRQLDDLPGPVRAPGPVLARSSRRNRRRLGRAWSDPIAHRAGRRREAQLRLPWGVDR